ncbi:MAG: hypothetical protein B6I17_04520 [Tenericutes bacterium 4572_104]|nr:MAG: hypothetical protein B6I17_04520 [Tenericutes bacterium 4572_104]
MLTTVDLNGFKSFVSDTIDLGKLTLLTGLNSSGKSSVIQAILMLAKASRKEEIFLEGHGDIAGLRNPYTKKIEIAASFENGSIVSLCNDKVNLDGDIIFPEIIHISADRFGPETTIPIFMGNNKTLGKRGENILKCIDAYEDESLPDILKHDKSQGDTFGYNLEAWLSVISPNTKFKHEIQKKTDSSFATFNGYRAKNVGFGLSYALPVIVALLLGSITPNSLVIIENPEAHLHPKGQTEIARLISLCVETGTQVIVETHSDHLFDGIRIQAKKSKSNFHEKINTYWFELDDQDNTDVQMVVIDKNGRLDSCPDGLFDQFEINARELI